MKDSKEERSPFLDDVKIGSRSLNQDEAYNFYSSFITPLTQVLPNKTDRESALAWLKKLNDEETGPNRINYVLLLNYALQRGKLFGPFARPPTADKLEKINDVVEWTMKFEKRGKFDNIESKNEELSTAKRKKRAKDANTLQKYIRQMQLFRADKELERKRKEVFKSGNTCGELELPLSGRDLISIFNPLTSNAPALVFPSERTPLQKEKRSFGRTPKEIESLKGVAEMPVYSVVPAAASPTESSFRSRKQESRSATTLRMRSGASKGKPIDPADAKLMRRNAGFRSAAGGNFRETAQKNLAKISEKFAEKIPKLLASKSYVKSKANVDEGEETKTISIHVDIHLEFDKCNEIEQVAKVLPETGDCNEKPPLLREDSLPEDYDFSNKKELSLIVDPIESLEFHNKESVSEIKRALNPEKPLVDITAQKFANSQYDLCDKCSNPRGKMGLCYEKFAPESQLQREKPASFFEKTSSYGRCEHFKELPVANNDEESKTDVFALGNSVTCEKFGFPKMSALSTPWPNGSQLQPPNVRISDFHKIDANHKDPTLQLWKQEESEIGIKSTNPRGLSSMEPMPSFGANVHHDSKVSQSPSPRTAFLSVSHAQSLSFSSSSTTPSGSSQHQSPCFMIPPTTDSPTPLLYPNMSYHPPNASAHAYSSSYIPLYIPVHAIPQPTTQVSNYPSLVGFSQHLTPSLMRYQNATDMSPDSFRSNIGAPNQGAFSDIQSSFPQSHTNDRLLQEAALPHDQNCKMPQSRYPMSEHHQKVRFLERNCTETLAMNDGYRNKSAEKCTCCKKVMPTKNSSSMEEPFFRPIPVNATSESLERDRCNFISHSSPPKESYCSDGTKTESLSLKNSTLNPILHSSHTAVSAPTQNISLPPALKTETPVLSQNLKQVPTSTSTSFPTVAHTSTSCGISEPALNLNKDKAQTLEESSNGATQNESLDCPQNSDLNQTPILVETRVCAQPPKPLTISSTAKSNSIPTCGLPASADECLYCSCKSSDKNTCKKRLAPSIKQCFSVRGNSLKGSHCAPSLCKSSYDQEKCPKSSLEIDRTSCLEARKQMDPRASAGDITPAALILVQQLEEMQKTYDKYTEIMCSDDCPEVKRSKLLAQCCGMGNDKDSLVDTEQFLQGMKDLENYPFNADNAIRKSFCAKGNEPLNEADFEALLKEFEGMVDSFECFAAMLSHVECKDKCRTVKRQKPSLRKCKAGLTKGDVGVLLAAFEKMIQSYDRFTDSLCSENSRYCRKKKKKIQKALKKQKELDCQKQILGRRAMTASGQDSMMIRATDSCSMGKTACESSYSSQGPLNYTAKKSPVEQLTLAVKACASDQQFKKNTNDQQSREAPSSSVCKILSQKQIKDLLNKKCCEQIENSHGESTKAPPDTVLHELSCALDKLRDYDDLSQKSSTTEKGDSQENLASCPICCSCSTPRNYGQEPPASCPRLEGSSRNYCGSQSKANESRQRLAGSGEQLGIPERFDSVAKRPTHFYGNHFEIMKPTSCRLIFNMTHSNEQVSYFFEFKKR